MCAKCIGGNIDQVHALLISCSSIKHVVRHAGVAKRQLGVLGAAAAWRLGEWQLLDTYLAEINGLGSGGMDPESDWETRLGRVLSCIHQRCSWSCVNVVCSYCSHLRCHGCPNGKVVDVTMCKCSACAASLAVIKLPHICAKNRGAVFPQNTCTRFVAYRDNTSLHRELEGSRQDIMARISAASMDSYSRAYPHVVKLHMLQAWPLARCLLPFTSVH